MLPLKPAFSLPPNAQIPSPKTDLLYFQYEAHWSSYAHPLGSSEIAFAKALCSTNQNAWEKLYLARMDTPERASDALRLLGVSSSWMGFSNTNSFPSSLLAHTQSSRSPFLPQNTQTPEKAFYVKHFYAFQKQLSLFLLLSRLEQMSPEKILPKQVQHKSGWTQDLIDNPARPATHLAKPFLACFVHFFTPLLFLQEQQKIEPHSLSAFVQYMHNMAPAHALQKPFQTHYYDTNPQSAHRKKRESTVEHLKNIYQPLTENEHLFEQCSFFLKAVEHNAKELLSVTQSLQENFNEDSFPYTSTDQFDAIFVPAKDQGYLPNGSFSNAHWLLPPMALYSAHEALALHLHSNSHSDSPPPAPRALRI